MHKERRVWKKTHGEISWKTLSLISSFNKKKKKIIFSRLTYLTFLILREQWKMPYVQLFDSGRKEIILGRRDSKLSHSCPCDSMVDSQICFNDIYRCPALNDRGKEGGCVRREKVCWSGEVKRGRYMKECGRDMWDKEWVQGTKEKNVSGRNKVK